MAQKTSPEALELSVCNTELTKRNKHHHHLGPSGYYAKKEQFRKMDEEATTAGNIDVINLKVHSRNWIYTRSTESSSDNLKFDKLETQEAVSRILKYAEDKEKCGGMAPKTWVAPSKVARPTRSRRARHYSACTARHCIVPNRLLYL